MLTYDRTWDTAGIFARDIHICRKIAGAWLDGTALHHSPKVGPRRRKRRLLLLIARLAILFHNMANRLLGHRRPRTD
jgi:hypothetical protein